MTITEMDDKFPDAMRRVRSDLASLAAHFFSTHGLPLENFNDVVRKWSLGQIMVTVSKYRTRFPHQFENFA